MTILVTGATGSVGRQVVRELLERGHQVRAMTRNPAKAAFSEEVEVVRGDLNDLDSLRAALEGTSAVHLIDVSGDDYKPLSNGQEIVELLAGRTVTLLAAWDAGTLEPALRASDLDWAYIQPTEFMSNALEWAQAVREHNRIEEAFASTKTVMVHEGDIGAVAAVVLTTTGHYGKTYGLTGGERLDLHDKVRILGEAIGREIEFVELTVDQLRARYAAQGVGPEMVDFHIRVFGEVPEDAYQPTTTVQDVTGRPPRTFKQWATENAAAFLG